MSLPSRLLVITDRGEARRPLDEIAEAICSTDLCGWLLLRDKDMPRHERADLARRLRAITRRTGTALSISADTALARECGADGLHLQTLDAVREARALLGPSIVIGLSTHAPVEAAAAAEAGADYVTLSPIFTTSSKPGYGPALGTAALSRASTSGIPVLALAGVAPASVAGCIAAGAGGVAVMGGVMRAEDPVATVAAFRRALDAAL